MGYKKDEIQKAELKEFLTPYFVELSNKVGFNSENKIYKELSIMFPFCSPSTIRRALKHTSKQVSRLSEVNPNQTTLFN